MRISFISDTHGLVHLPEIGKSLPGGDILIHAGDCLNTGYSTVEIIYFFEWMSDLPYENKILVPGNHDWYFQIEPDLIWEWADKFGITLLIDSSLVLDVEKIFPHRTKKNLLIYGSPWQPAFNDWAFNLPRNGEELEQKWKAIPPSVDILITHGPPFSYLDYSTYGNQRVGCELLQKRIEEIKPPIHVFGHIHSSYGTHYNAHTEFINASCLDSNYHYTNPPIHMEWDGEKSIEYIDISIPGPGFTPTLK